MVNVKFDPEDMLDKFAELSSKADAAMWKYVETGALQVQNYARAHRPWTDRTGAARQRLTGTPSARPGGYRITLAHGVDYGIWLELAHEKRFAIIEPTIKAKGPNIMEGFDNLLSKL